MFVNKEKMEKGIKIFCLCCIIMNLQEKPQSNMATLHFQTKPPLPFCLNPPFSVKVFRTLPPPPPPPTSLPSILDKLSSGTLWRGWGRVTLQGGFTLCMVPIGTLSLLFFYFRYNPAPYFESKCHPPLFKVLIKVINFSYDCLCRLM